MIIRLFCSACVVRISMADFSSCEILDHLQTRLAHRFGKVMKMMVTKRTHIATLFYNVPHLTCVM